MLDVRPLIPTVKPQMSGFLSVSRGLVGVCHAKSVTKQADLVVEHFSIITKPIWVCDYQKIFLIDTLKFNITWCGDLAPPHEVVYGS